MIQKRLNCSNEQTEDVIMQSMPFESLEMMLVDSFESESDVFDFEADVFEKHSNACKRLLAEKLAVPSNLTDEIEKEEMKNRVNAILNTLTDREQKVIRDRFGFDNGSEKTLEEVGMDFGVTRERIRQIESKVMKKLSHSFRLKRLQEYI